MPSMDYCKFENTAIDMAKCVAHLEDERRLPSSREAAAFKRLKMYCERFLEYAEDYNTETTEHND